MSIRRHTIVIEGESTLWTRLVIPGQFRRYSRELYSIIEANTARGQRESRIKPSSILTNETLQRLVLWIDQGVPAEYSLTFDELLQLSIAIWQYGCDPKAFRKLAAAKDEVISHISKTNAVASTFITLVFDWELDFWYASQHLVCDFDSPLGVIEGDYFFPAILKGE
jgi:hypothetical protein